MHMVSDIFRILFLIIGILITCFYVLAQIVQKLPKNPLRFKFSDGLIYGVVSCLLGFSLNSYLALCSFIPLVLWKILAHQIIRPHSFFVCSGQWFEVNWKTMTPRGFGPQYASMMGEVSRLPQGVHILVPRFLVLLGLKILRWWFKKAWKKNAVTTNASLPPISAQQQDMAYGELLKMMQSVQHIERSGTDTKSFPFGVLRISRY